MKLMHTKFPEFLAKMRAAVQRGGKSRELEIRGLENIRTANTQSLRTGRIEAAVAEIAGRPEVAKVQFVVMPRVPETMHTVIVKGIDAQGTPTKAILDVINILHPTEDVELVGCKEIEDRRPPLGKH